MATPPTFVATYGPGAASTTATQTASVTVAAGDLLVLTAGTGNPTWIPQTPTGGTGITWTLVANHGNVSGQTNLYTWAATVSTAQTFTCSVTAAGTGNQGWSWQIHRWSNHGGVGAVATTGNGGSAPSLALTTTGPDSGISLFLDDWNQTSSSTRTYNTATAGAATETYYNVGANETLYFAYYADAGAAGAKTVGMTSPTGQAPSMNAVEVKSATGAVVQSNSATVASISGTSFTVSLPAGTTAGNLLIAAYNGSGNFSTPAGWTLIRASDTFNDLHVYYKTATAGETSWSFPGTSGGKAAWYVQERSGVSAPDQNAAASTTSGVTSLAVGPTSTLAQANELALVFVGFQASASTIAASGYTQDVNLPLSSASLWVGEKVVSTTSGVSASLTSSTSTQLAGIIATFPVVAPPAYSGSFTGSSAGTLTASGTPRPAGSATFSGSGSLAGSGTPRPAGAATLSGAGTFAVQPGTRAAFAATGTLAVAAFVDFSTTAALGGDGALSAGTPHQLALAAVGSLEAAETSAGLDGGTVELGGAEGQLAATGEPYHFCFSGPTVYDYRPLEKAYPQLLHVWIPYGKTVWRDASGEWHDKFGPQPTELDGALRVFPGGRCNHLDNDELAELLDSPYADLIHMEKTL